MVKNRVKLASRDFVMKGFANLIFITAESYSSLIPYYALFLPLYKTQPPLCQS